MDKLRALQYFATAAEEGSFSRAARRLDVSVPAVAKLIGALERSVGCPFFERTPRGLALTADGRDYLDACLPAIEQLAAADESLRGAASRPRGTLVVGATPQLAQHCLAPSLPKFRARYPDIDIDIRSVYRVDDVEPGTIDVYLLHGWPEHGDLVHRRIAVSRLLTCASPGYWAEHGVPDHPQEMAQHTGLFLRNPEGTVLDLWEYERAGQVEAVPMRGWLASDHRDILLDAALAGQGVARLVDFTCGAHLQSGRLVPVLLQWEMKGAPPVSLLFRPSHRRTSRVRVFIDFVTTVFRELEAQRVGLAMANPTEPPAWYRRRRYGRASSAIRGQ
jgi:LysR family transcriptional regulator for bpeEF and oprC